MNRSELLRAIQIADFALTEANLFLDSHPDDENALRYYAKYKARLDELMEEYYVPEFAEDEKAKDKDFAESCNKAVGVIKAWS